MSSANPLSGISTIAVTGATGLIGRRLVPAIQAHDATARILLRSPIQPSAGVRPILGHLQDPGAFLPLLHNASALVHLAGVAHTDLRSPAERAHAHAVNVTASVNLFTAARDAGVPHAVFLSSAHVYAAQRGLDLSESSPTSPDSPYSTMKLEAESALQALASPTFTVTILRPCLIYGPGVRFNLAALLRAVHRGLYVHPRGADALRSFASVDTISAAILHLLGQGTGGTFNVADRHPVSLRAWVDTLADLLAVRRPRSIPAPILRTLATLGSAAAQLGVPATLTRDSFRKLTAPFTLDLTALAATGFEWPQTTAQVLRQMADAYLAAPLTRPPEPSPAATLRGSA